VRNLARIETPEIGVRETGGCRRIVRRRVQRGLEMRRRASEVGAAEFLAKPVDFDLLKEQLRQLPRPTA